MVTSALVHEDRKAHRLHGITLLIGSEVDIAGGLLSPSGSLPSPLKMEWANSKAYKRELLDGRFGINNLKQYKTT